MFLFVILTGSAYGQYNWKPEKDKDGIKVYTSGLTDSKFKAIKVECTLAGTYSKLISVLSDVASFDDWIYNAKNCQVLKKNSPNDFIYYSETHLPWPLSNRDIVIHFRIRTDSIPKSLTITGTNENGIIPEILSKVRVPHYQATWHVTMPSANSIHIVYILTLDPGGSIPAWLTNMFADKGPYETFTNLGKLLMK